MAVSLAELTAYLDTLLLHDEVPDYGGSHNGLQVANDGTVEQVAVAVDAAQATIDAAVQRGADFLLVHHGLFWDGEITIVGRRWRRIKTLLTNDVALYSTHLPLDAHPEFGNNARLARALGLTDLERFGEYDGYPLGFAGRFDGTRDELAGRVRDALDGAPLHVIPGGPEQVSRVGVITGGAGSMIHEAAAAGLDAFVTGEGSHHTHFDAMESRINVIYGGHYATETFGVRALGEHLAEQFDLGWEFLDYPTGL